MKLYNSLKSLILEIASVDSVTDSIKNRQVVSIYYTGDEPGGKGLRVIEPVGFGLSKRNNPVIRAWQRLGVSDSPDNIPGWRMFRLDRIKTFTVLDERFTEPKPNFNPNGDKDLVKIYTLASF